MAEIDDCVTCPIEKGFCSDIIQTKSSDAVLELITYTNDATGGFDFRFMAINATALGNSSSMFCQWLPSFLKNVLADDTQ